MQWGPHPLSQQNAPPKASIVNAANLLNDILDNRDAGPSNLTV